MANLADIFAQADYDQSIAGVIPDESQLQETAQAQKLIDLQNKAIEKVEALSKKTGSLGIPPPLTTGKGLNTASAAELQQALSDAIDQQIYTDPQGNKYQERYTQDAQGNTVITKVPYTAKNKYGTMDARNLYIDTTEDGNYKLGLARADKGFMGRYTPGEKYGWAPGPKGVTPQNGALLDISLPYNTATQLEYFVHSNKEQIRNRAMGTGPKSAESEAVFGSGQTEYTTPNAPMWNQNYDPKSVKTQITKDTPLPKELKGILPALTGDAYEDAKARLRAGNEKFLGPKTQPEVKTVGDVLDRVKFALKGRESQGNYKAVNDYGYAGAYQMGGEVLEGLGMVKPGTKTKDLWRPEVWTGKYGVRSRGDFLNNEDLQDKLMDQHLQGLYKQLSGNATDLRDLAGKISAAHLLGVKGSQNLEKKDAYGTSGNEYYKLGADALGIKQKYINAMRNAPERREEGSIGNTLKGMVATIPAVAENILKAPSSLYNALGGDYLEEGSSFEKEHPTWASATKAVINTLKDASQYVHAFNTDVVGYDAGAMEQLQKDVGKAFDEKRYVTGVLGAIVDNPLGAVDLGVSSYGFAKAMTAPGLKGLAATPAILGSFSDNMEKSVEVFRKEYGREPVGDEMAAIAGLSTIGTALDTVAAHKIFNSARGDIASKAIGEAIDTLIGKVPTTVAKVALKNVQKVGAYMAIEGLQEAGTEATTILGGTQDWDKFTKPEHMKAVFTAGATGGIAGPGMKATDVVFEGSKAALTPEARQTMLDVLTLGKFFKRDELEINPAEFATWDAKEKKDHYNKVTQKMALDLSKLDAVTAYNSSEDKTIPDLQKAFEQTRALYDVGPDASEDLVTSAYTLMSGKIMDTLGSKLKGTPIQFLTMGRMLRDNAPTEGAKQQVWDLVVEASEFEIQDKAPDFFKELRERMEGALPLEGLQLKESEREKLKELKTQLGSEDFGGEQSPVELIDMVLQFGTPNAPTFADVSKQIEETGTTLFGRYKKSLKQHERDITAEMLETKANDDGKVLTSNLDALGKFVGSRTLGKLHPVFKMWDETTKVYSPKVRSIASIHKLAETIVKDNVAIERTVDKLIEQARLNGNSVAEQELLDMKEKLVANNAEMQAVLQIDNAKDMMAMLEHVESRDGRDAQSINDIVKDLGGTERVVTQMESMPRREQAESIADKKPLKEEKKEDVKEEKKPTLGKTATEVKDIVDDLKELSKARESDTDAYAKNIAKLRKIAEDEKALIDDGVVQTLIYVLEEDQLKAGVMNRLKGVLARKIAGTKLTSTQAQFVRNEITKIQKEQESLYSGKNKYTYKLAKGELNKQAEEVKAAAEVQVSEDVKDKAVQGKFKKDLDSDLKKLSAKERAVVEEAKEADEAVEEKAEVQEIDTTWMDPKDVVKMYQESLDLAEAIMDEVRPVIREKKRLEKEHGIPEKGASLTEGQLQVYNMNKGIQEKLKELNDELAKVGVETIEDLKDKLEDAKNHELYDMKTTEAIADLGGPLGLVAGKKSKKLTRLLARALATKDGTLKAITASYMSLNSAKKEKEVVAKFVKLLPSAYKRRFERQAEQAGVTVEDVVGTFLKEKLLPVYARADKSVKEGENFLTNSLTSVKGLLAAYAKEGSLGAPHVMIQKFFENIDAAKNGKDVEAYNAVVVAIMNAAALTYGDVLDVVGLKGDMLKDYVEGGFGLEEGTDQYEAAKRLVVTGRGVPMAAIRQSAGRRVMDELGIKIGDKSRVALEGELIAVFGQIVIETMKDPRAAVGGSGLSGKIGVKKGVFDKETGMLKDEMTEAEKQEVDETKTAAVLLLNISQENKQLLREVAGTLEFMGEQSDGAIGLKPKKEKKGKMKVLHSAVVAGDTTVEYANKKNAEEWTFEGTFPDFYADVVKEAKGDPEKALQIATEAILGKRDDVIAKEQVSDVEGALAKYDAEALAIQRMFMAYDVVGKDVPFYLNWAYIISGRYMIANRMMNPQNSKISRHFVSTKDMRSTMDRESEDFKKDLDIARLAMAQAFDGADLGVDVDLGIDKLLDEEGLRQFDKLVTFDAKGKPTAVNKKIKAAMDAYRGKGMLAAMKALDFVDVSHKTHALQAIDLLVRLEGDEKKITHTMTIEADGITNGMIIMLLQIGGERAIELLRAGGVYFDKEGKMTHAQYKAEGGSDIYEMPKAELEAKFNRIVEVSEDIEKLKEMLFGKNGIYYGDKEEIDQDEVAKQVQAMVQMVQTNVGTKWRKALKPMVMVFIYGAGMKGIIANGAGRNGYGSGMIVDGLVELVKNEENHAMVKEFLKTMGAESKMQYKVYNKEKGMLVNDASKDIKNLYVTPEMEKHLVGKFADAFTGMFEDVFTNAFEPVIKLRKALKTLSVVQYAVFRIELAKKVADKTQITKEELASVLREMMKEGTYYGATNAQGTWQDYVKMEKGIASPDMDAADKIAAVVFENEIGTKVGQRPMTLNAVMKWFKSNTGAVGVINAHDTDGQTMAKGNTTGALNIYDALVLAASTEAKGDIEGMNKALAGISGEHSMVDKAIKLVEKHLDTLRVEDLEADVVEELADALSWAYGVKDKGELGDVHAAEFASAMEAITEGRKQLVGRKAVVNHYYVSDMLASEEAVELGDVVVPNMEKENIDKVTQFVKDVLDVVQEKENNKAETNTKLDRIQNMTQKDVNPNDVNMMICKE